MWKSLLRVPVPGVLAVLGVLVLLAALRLGTSAPPASDPEAILTGPYEVSAVGFSPDGRTLAVADVQGRVRLWDADTFRGERPAPDGHADVVWALAYSPDGRLLASGSRDGALRLWDADTGAEAARLGHGGRVYGLAFSPDGRSLAVATGDGTVELW